MPLLDHFHPPIHPRHHWESFHSNWATRIADALNEKWLPPEYLAEEYTQGGTRLEIDVATFDQEETTNGPPPAAPCSMPAAFPETFEVRVFSNTGGATLVAAVELISPANKDRPEERRAFATKCASYLYQGVSLIIIDVVTSRQGNLHNEIMQVMKPTAAFTGKMRPGSTPLPIAPWCVTSAPRSTYGRRHVPWARRCRSCRCDSPATSSCQSTSRQPIKRPANGAAWCERLHSRAFPPWPSASSDLRRIEA
jgi:hypothetical protein